ncbi:MAG: hypothetical protein NW223_10515 [Hyphomicrobiaceae bacterium]|nr:hypothetical protein [Hyphomicrobiaceae bacterium]
MMRQSRFDRKVEEARERLHRARSQPRENQDREPSSDPLLAYDLALLASESDAAADRDNERALSWRWCVGAVALVLIVSALAILAARPGLQVSALLPPPLPP